MKICEACGTENDDTRVFCMSCGARLPAPAAGSLPGLPKNPVANVGATAPPVSTFRPAGQSSKPGKIRQARRGFFETLFALLPWLLLAGLGVAIYLATLPPADIPAPATPDISESNRLADFLKKASETSGGAFQADQGAINRFLAASVRLQPVSNLFGLKTDYTRCYARLSDNRLDFTLQIEIQGHPLYLTLGLAPAEKKGRLVPEVVGAQFGRLPLPAPIASLARVIWSPCFDSLENVIVLLRGAQSAKVEDGRIVFRWPGGSESPR
jgi:hypothetical protein